MFVYKFAGFLKVMIPAITRRKFYKMLKDKEARLSADFVYKTIQSLTMSQYF